MNPRGFHFQFQGRRGLPTVLPLIFLAIIAIGLIALLVFVGLAVAVVGLVVSACAALYFAVRRMLTGDTRPSGIKDQAHPTAHPQEIKVIEVEAVRINPEAD